MDVSFWTWLGSEFHNRVVDGTNELWNVVSRFMGNVWVFAFLRILPVSLIRMLGMMEVIYVGSCDCGCRNMKYMMSLWMVRRVFSESQPNSRLSLSVDPPRPPRPPPCGDALGKSDWGLSIKSRWVYTDHPTPVGCSDRNTLRKWGSAVYAAPPSIWLLSVEEINGRSHSNNCNELTSNNSSHFSLWGHQCKMLTFWHIHRPHLHE